MYLPPPRPPLSPMSWLSLDWDQQRDYEDEDKTCSDGAEDHRRLPVPPILFFPSLFERAADDFTRPLRTPHPRQLFSKGPVAAWEFRREVEVVSS